MLIKTYGSAVYGVDAVTITVEVGIDKTSNKYYMVGLPDNAVKESLQRIEMSLKHVGYKMPRYKIVINLAPADIRKEGSAYDLPIAIGILIASGQIEDKLDVSQYIIMGELSLDGTIQPIRGALPISIQARKEKFQGFILPKYNEREAGIVDKLDVYGVQSLKDVIDIIEKKTNQQPVIVDTRAEFEENVNSNK